MKLFIIADPHFGHKNVITYCSRPFSSVENMDRELIKRWNNTVSKKDKVFFLGDFALDKATIQKIAPQLNGMKTLVKGNHDSYPDEFYSSCGFKEVSKYPILVQGFYLMSHEPLLLSQTTPYFNFHGHVHNDAKYIDTPTSKCVSVERIDYTPYCFLEI